jgi:predicted ATPase
MIHLQFVQLKPNATQRQDFPFNLPLVQQFAPIELRAPVCFLVGENGSGKSTFLEALAVAVGSVTVGGEDLQRDKTLVHARALAKQLRLTWRHKTPRGFFLRAEDFFNFARRLNRMTEELEEAAAEFEQEYKGYALGLAKGAVLGQKRALVERYGKDLDANSHGESFLKLFQARFVPGGLYLLDEPEAPLSPQRQLALLAMLKEMVTADAQFIIATHSPILMAFPEAAIFSFDQHPIQEVAYETVEHVDLTRRFLNNPAAFLRHL